MDYGSLVIALAPLPDPVVSPLGVLVLVAGNPDIDFLFKYTVDEKEFIFDTSAMRAILGDIPLNDPEVVKFFINYLDEYL